MKQIIQNATLLALLLITSSGSYVRAQNTWTQKADFGGTVRWFASGFSIGSKGYIGTGSSNNGVEKDFWEYNPNADTWTQKADFGGTARTAAVGFSIGGKGYIGTGGSINGLEKDFWEYDPDANTWTQKADFGGTGRSGAVGFSIGSKGYLGTGEDLLDRLKDFWEYDPVANTWAQKANVGGHARSYAAGFNIGSKGYIGTGYSYTAPYFEKDFWEYDPDANTWTQKADFGGTGRGQASGFSIGTKGYIGGGNQNSHEKDFWEYDPGTNSWTEKSDLNGGGRYAATSFSIDGKGYIGTGNVSNYLQKDFWEYTPDNICLIPVAAITSLGNLDICETGFIKLQASSGDNYIYQWNRNQVDIPGATDQFFKAKKSGNYRVRVSTGPGCHAVSKKTVVYSSCKLREEDEFISQFNLYPNPTTGTFMINLSIGDEETSEATIQIINLLGQIVHEEKVWITQGLLQKEIQLNDAAGGIYLVTVIINDQVYSSQISYQK